MTTRQQRPGEVDGRDYHFIDAARFDAMVAERRTAGMGARCSAIATARRARRSRRRWCAGRDVLFDIDWQGTQQLREKADRDLVSIFVLPPSIPDLERRLRTRAQDSDERDPRAHGQGRRRDEPLGRSTTTSSSIPISITPSRRCDAILAAERLKRERQTGLSDFVRRLQAKL